MSVQFSSFTSLYCTRLKTASDFVVVLFVDVVTTVLSFIITCTVLAL